MIYDIIVIGGGPAGLTAALYGLRQGKFVVVFEKGTFGGQITFSPCVENIPGFLDISGNEFADKMIDQVLSHGGDVLLAEVFGVKKEDGLFFVETEDGVFRGKSVIIATGAAHRHLGVEGEDKFIGDGISFCAVCDGSFYRHRTVAVIGGGNSALQEALLLEKKCKKVYIIQNLPHLTGEAKLEEKLKLRDNVEFIFNATVNRVLGEDKFEGIELSVDGQTKTLSLDGMFVAIGLSPQNEIFENVLALDSFGYADSDESCVTKTDGVFVAGDCRKKQVRQLTTAAADGAIAALAACKYLDK